ncbi:hypothetical protein [Nocardioides sp. B-3]|uniref:hypothetical protein n=1 Tax=Nocardioides sp. B-3 TaxID=2895565 RepID=UPI0021537BC6|nr:hypothetical protein [Nocardioides sp. B-3]UUZ57806.1 hypothetical protein LP418_15510 [Nocardioides sp. B-3]
MDFIRYAESAAALLNADLPDVDALLDHLAQRVAAPDRGRARRDCAEELPVPSCDRSSRRPTGASPAPSSPPSTSCSSSTPSRR